MQYLHGWGCFTWFFMGVLVIIMTKATAGEDKL